MKFKRCKSVVDNGASVINSGGVVTLDGWTLDIGPEATTALKYENPKGDSSEVLIPDFITKISPDFKLDNKVKVLKLAPGNAAILNELKFRLQESNLEYYLGIKGKQMEESWGGLDVEKITVYTDADFAKLITSINTGHLSIENKSTGLRNTDLNKNNKRTIQEYLMLEKIDRRFKSLSQDEIRLYKLRSDIKLLEMMIENSDCGGLNVVTRDVLLKASESRLLSLGESQLELMYQVNCNLNKIGFKYNYYIDLDERVVQSKILDIIKISSIQSKYITTDLKFNADIFNIVFLRYTMKNNKYKVEDIYLDRLFYNIYKRIGEIVEERKEDGIEQINNYKHRNSELHVELINIFRLAGNYDKLFGYVGTVDMKFKIKEFIQFGNEDCIHNYKYDLEGAIERWFEYNKKLSWSIRENRNIGEIIELALNYDEDYILFNQSNSGKEEAIKLIADADIIVKGRVFKLIKKTITWSNRHFDDISKYLVVDYNLLTKIISSGEISNLTSTELDSIYGDDLLILKDLDIKLELVME